MCGFVFFFSFTFFIIFVLTLLLSSLALCTCPLPFFFGGGLLSVCALPFEYCENGPCPDRCKESRPAEEAGDGGDDEAGEAEGGGGKKSKRGGKATRASKAAQKVVAKPTGVVISITQRNKRKFVTNVTGLGSYGINLKKAAKAFAGRFACGAAVNGDDEIGITGDHTNEIADVIIDKFPEVLAADITFKKK